MKRQNCKLERGIISQRPFTFTPQATTLLIDVSFFFFSIYISETVTVDHRLCSWSIKTLKDLDLMHQQP